MKLRRIFRTFTQRMLPKLNGLRFKDVFHDWERLFI
jgi:hypothetical protein